MPTTAALRGGCFRWGSLGDQGSYSRTQARRRRIGTVRTWIRSPRRQSRRRCAPSATVLLAMTRRRWQRWRAEGGDDDARKVGTCTSQPGQSPSNLERPCADLGRWLYQTRTDRLVDAALPQPRRANRATHHQPSRPCGRSTAASLPAAVRGPPRPKRPSPPPSARSAAAGRDRDALSSRASSHVPRDPRWVGPARCCSSV